MKRIKPVGHEVIFDWFNKFELRIWNQVETKLLAEKNSSIMDAMDTKISHKLLR